MALGTCLAASETTPTPDPCPTKDRPDSVLMSSRIPAGALGPEGNLLEASPGLLRLLGLEETQGFPLAPEFLFHPDDLDAVLQRLNELETRDNDPLKAEVRLLHRNRSDIPAELQLSPAPPDEGAPGGTILFVASDITDDVRSRARLRAGLERFRRIFALSPNPAGVTRASDGLFVEVNESFTRVFGYSREEVLGKTVVGVGMTDPQSRADYAKLASDQGALELHEIHYRTRSGEERPVLISMEPTDLEGEPHFLWQIVDISEKRALEAQVRQAQKLETLGNLAGGIAHDFNNLLVPILGYADLVEGGVPDDDPHRKELEPHLIAAALRARELVQQILTFSRKEEPVRKIIEVEQPVKNALRLITATLPASIRVLNRVHGTSGTILADGTQIQQVMLNLCTNAAHAMREKGGILEVSLETTEDLAELQAKHPEMTGTSAALLQVRDTGEGISREHLERIFDPFFTTKKEGEGTGLGLSVVYGIVRAHGGAVEVESRKGEGTCFRVFLPLAEAEKEQEDPMEVEEVLGTERVLVVDDQDQSRETMRRLLDRFGYRVTAVGAGASALELFGQDPASFDMAIIDYDMPDMNGIHLSLEMLHRRPDFPIALVTGTDPARVADSRRLGIRETIFKPFTAKELGRMVRTILAQDDPADQS